MAAVERVGVRLSAFLSAKSRAPLAWGRDDCLMDVADWALALTGVDPAAPWRGTYDDESGADAILAAHGGLVGLLDYGLVAAGWRRTCAPQPGDIGAIDVRTDRGPALTGAIRCGGRWACRGLKGRALIRAGAVAAWTWRSESCPRP